MAFLPKIIQYLKDAANKDVISEEDEDEVESVNAALQVSLAKLWRAFEDVCIYAKVFFLLFGLFLVSNILHM